MQFQAAVVRTDAASRKNDAVSKAEGRYVISSRTSFSTYQRIVEVHAIGKFRLTAVARMTNLARGNFQIRKRDLSIPPDCHDRLGPKRVEKPNQQRPTGLTFFARVTAVRHRIVPLMRMKRENIPEENWSLQIFQNLPNHRGRSLGNGRTFCRPRQRWRSEKLGVVDEMHLVGKREAGSSPSPITEVARYPHGLNATAHGCNENELKIAPADSRCIRLIVLIAGIGIWVENVSEFQRCHALDEIVDLEGVRSHLGQPSYFQSPRTVLVIDFHANP